VAESSTSIRVKNGECAKKEEKRRKDEEEGEESAGTDAPAVAHHEDIAAHLAVEHAREGDAMPEVATVPVEHDDGRPRRRKLLPSKQKQISHDGALCYTTRGREDGVGGDGPRHRCGCLARRASCSRAGGAGGPG
jgi:hypothetical protein